MKHPPFKNLCFKITSSRQKNSTSTQLFSDAREKRPFPRAVPSFRARIFGIKKNSLTRADGGRWSSLYDDRYHSVVLEHSAAAWCVTPLENAFRLVFEAFFLARRFAKIDYSWCVFFLFSLVFPQFHKTTHDTPLCARKSKRRTKKKTNNKSPLLSLSDDKAQQQWR